MKRNRTTTRLAAAVGMTIGLSLAGATTAGAEVPPSPGCGYGDTNHNHQAAPGLDPLGLRPGKGLGDEVNPHTAPPGQAPDGAGEPDDPRRGCNDSPLG